MALGHGRTENLSGIRMHGCMGSLRVLCALRCMRVLLVSGSLPTVFVCLGVACRYAVVLLQPQRWTAWSPISPYTYMIPPPLHAVLIWMCINVEVNKKPILFRKMQTIIGFVDCDFSFERQNASKSYLHTRLERGPVWYGLRLRGQCCRSAMEALP